jgi:hypothetical protein
MIISFREEENHGLSSPFIKETGRAGRDGREAVCLLYYSYHDKAKVCNRKKRETSLILDALSKIGVITPFLSLI